MKETTRRRRNPRGEGTRLRDEIVGAARDLLVEGGSDAAVTLRAVARRVGISAPSIYAHFEGPESIVRAVVAETFTALLTHLEAARAEADGPRARLVATCRAYLAFGAEQPALYALLFARSSPVDPAGPDPRLRESGEGLDRLVGAATFGLLVHDVAEAAAAGVSDTDPADAHLTATAIWTSMHGLVLLRANAPNFPWPAPATLDAAIVERLARLS